MPFLGALVLVGCDAPRYCTQCPALAGDYDMTWSAPVVTQECPDAGTPQAILRFTQYRMGLQSDVAGVSISGSIFDSWDFHLSGRTPQKTIVLSGKVQSDLGVPDGGIDIDGGPAITGILTIRMPMDSADGGDASSERCQIRHTYSAVRRTAESIDGGTK